jgi:hypothetical protein
MVFSNSIVFFFINKTSPDFRPRLFTTIFLPQPSFYPEESK